MWPFGYCGPYQETLFAGTALVAAMFRGVLEAAGPRPKAQKRRTTGPALPDLPTSTSDTSCSSSSILSSLAATLLSRCTVTRGFGRKPRRSAA